MFGSKTPQQKATSSYICSRENLVFCQRSHPVFCSNVIFNYCDSLHCLKRQNILSVSRIVDGINFTVVI